MKFQYVENLICQHSLVQHCVVVGDEENYLSALIAPDFQELRRLLASDEKNKELLEMDERKMVNNLEIRRYFCDILQDVNKDIQGPKKVDRFSLVNEDYKEQLRNIIMDDNQHTIRSFYEEIPPGIG
jgi:long-subunit acyl-CoA synthetase (AMP-forming)